MATQMTDDGLRLATEQSHSVMVRRAGLWLSWGQHSAGPRWQDNYRWGIVFADLAQAQAFCAEQGYEGVEYLDNTF